MTTPRLPFAITALVIAGCSSQMHSAPRERPSRPSLGAPIDRVGRPLIGNALLGPTDTADASDRRKEQYNRAAPGAWPSFIADMERTLGLYDGLDRTCGNQWLADQRGAPAMRYHALATLFADDRLWINSQSTRCTQYLAVERAALAVPGAATADCGGRTPGYDVNNRFRSLLIRGTLDDAVDGIVRDDHEHSTIVFPFLAAP